METSKLVTSEQAVQVIMDGDTIATGGFAEELALALRKRFDETKSPKDIYFGLCSRSRRWKRKRFK